MDDLGKRALAAKELKNARNALLWVGLIMFVMDMIFIHAVYGDRLPSDIKTRLTVLSAVLFAGFIALYVFSKQKPRLCLTLGLVLFWGIQLFNMAADPKSITQGIVLKVLFTMALVKGLRSAKNAEDLTAELQKVFE
jgi:hypothetical protein